MATRATTPTHTNNHIPLSMCGISGGSNAMWRPCLCFSVLKVDREGNRNRGCLAVERSTPNQSTSLTLTLTSERFDVSHMGLWQSGSITNSECLLSVCETSCWCLRYGVVTPKDLLSMSLAMDTTLFTTSACQSD